MATVARNSHHMHPLVIAAQVAYDDSGIAAGTLEFNARLPANAFVLRTTVDITTAFAATTTNVLTVGTVSGTANDIVASGDVDETSATSQLVTGPGVINATAEEQLFVKFTGAGAANTAGAATLLVEYIDLNLVT